MTDFLVFTLVAPMGSFGDLAGHERRGTHRWPSRSAVLGLLGAAFGIRRDDCKGQKALGVWKTAVSRLQVGEAWQDFHTVQTVPSARIKQPATRRDALAALKRSDNGLITKRAYRSDCAFGVALWGGKLEGAKQALERPAFTPYLGRKSCPLSAPMAPRIVSADTVAKALTEAVLPDFIGLDPAQAVLIASDEPPPSDKPLASSRSEIRWDVPLDREGWHFGQRRVYLYKLGEGA